jgi:hypothetical protein
MPSEPILPQREPEKSDAILRAESILAGQTVPWVAETPSRERSR